MVLRTLEQKIEALFEGVFGRAFRTNVQPVELARKLAKEMDDHRTISVSRVYVPNEYTVYLAPDDREQFSSYEENLKGELQEYLSEHSRREEYALLSPVRVLMETDSELRQEGASYWIVDLGSTNGLEVNGKRVKRAKLNDGDTITVGSTEVRFSQEPQ